LNRGATASGRLDIGTSRTTVQHLDGGTVSEVLVKEGQVVAKGEVLIRMDDQQLRLQVGQYRAQRRQRLIEQAVLNAEITGGGVVFRRR
jgi:multidrug efflux pump subunit AcrA (membrane-fusion protein)